MMALKIKIVIKFVIVRYMETKVIIDHLNYRMQTK